MEGFSKDVQGIINDISAYDRYRFHWFGLEQIIDTRESFDIYYVFNEYVLYVINVHQDDHYNQTLVSTFKRERIGSTIEEECAVYERQLFKKSNNVRFVPVDDGVLTDLCRSILTEIAGEEVYHFQVQEPELGDITDGISYDEYEEVCNKILNEGVVLYDYKPTDKRIKCSL